MAARPDSPDPRDLSTEQCRELLLASEHAYLACSRWALPLVVPADLDCTDGEVRVTVHDHRLCGSLTGHVVALAVGSPAAPGEPGWTVVACGRFGEPEEGSAALPLDISSLQGWTFDRPAQDPARSPAGPALR